jgi:hypothetical protein
MAMARPIRKLPYKEGTWFAVPLLQGGYAIGRVARLAPEGKILLAYLFGPKHDTVATVDELDDLEPPDALKVIQISDLGLIDGSWPVIGDSPRWQREEWPMPAFIRRNELSKTAWRVNYSDDDPNTVVSEESIPYETTGLEAAGFYGSGAVEYVLSKVLDA